MAIIFRYAHIPRPDGSLRKAPFIPIKAINKSGRPLKIIALVDSGADDTVIPKDLVRLLGLKEQKEETETAGIGGKVKVRKATFKQDEEKIVLKKIQPKVIY